MIAHNVTPKIEVWHLLVITDGIRAENITTKIINSVEASFAPYFPESLKNAINRYIKEATHMKM